VTAPLQHPALILAALGAASGVLGTSFLGLGYGDAPHFGVYMVLTGVWFGLVMAYGVWRWGTPSWTAAAAAFIATWLGWEAAVNLALQIDRSLLDAGPIIQSLKSYLAGFAAGTVGAFLTWAGAAAYVPALRRPRAAATIATTGALFGLLLPWTNHYDTGIVLLVPWQAAVAAMFGLNMAPAHASEPPETPAFAIER
jgi:hypothetical protein